MNSVRITEHLPLRSLVIVLVSALALTALAGHLYVLKQPLAELAALEDTLFETRRGRPLDGPADARIALAEQEIAALRERLGGSAPDLAPNEMVAFVIGQLDLLARDRQVQLVSVEPGAIARVFEFDEIPFHIEVVGGYFSIVAWLHEAEQELGPMVIKSFSLAPATNPASRRMQLTMVSYRASGGDA